MIECGAQHESGHTSATPYTTLIRACGKALEVDKAFRVLHCMLDVGVRPNVVTFNCLIDACGKASQVCVSSHHFTPIALYQSHASHASVHIPAIVPPLSPTRHTPLPYISARPHPPLFPANRVCGCACSSTRRSRHSS